MDANPSTFLSSALAAPLNTKPRHMSGLSDSIGCMPYKPAVFRPHHLGPRNQYDKDRGSARQRGYTPDWDRESRVFKRAHPLCLGCQAVGRVTQTAVTDHIIPHRGDHKLMWDRDNLQPSCSWHHDVVKQQLELMYDRGEASKADLRLDSRLAVELTKREGSRVSVDGWLIN